MPRLGNYSYRDIRRGIDKLPVKFRETRERNAWYYLDGKAVFPIQAPRVHQGVVPIGTVNSIRQGLQLNTSDFQDLIACPLTATDYERIIREKLQAGTIRPIR